MNTGKESENGGLLTENQSVDWKIIPISESLTRTEKILLLEAPDALIENGVASIKKAILNGSEIPLKNLEEIYNGTSGIGQPISVFISLACKTLNDVLRSENKENPIQIEKVLREDNGSLKLVKKHPGTKTEIAPKPDSISPKTNQVQPKTDTVSAKEKKPVEEPKPTIREAKKETKGEPKQPQPSLTLFDIAKEAKKKAESAQQPEVRKKAEPNPEPAKENPKKEPLIAINEEEKPKTGRIKLPDEEIVVRQLLDLLKTPSTDLDMAVKTENPKHRITAILIAMKSLGFVSTKPSGPGIRTYSLRMPRQDIPENAGKLVKIARLVREDLNKARDRTRDVKNISREIIGEKPEAVTAVIKVICLMAENEAAAFTSNNDADIGNLESESDKAAAIAEGKYPELRIKLN